MAAAIHDGHALGEEVAASMTLSATERLREEDPHTGEWSRIALVRLIGRRSRFEVDLNRLRERAIDLARVHALLLDVAARNPLCLHEPVPLVIFQGFGDSGIDLQLSVWAARQNFLEVRNSIAQQVKATFDAEGVEIPFPHVSLYTGSASPPLSVRLTSDTGRAGERDPGQTTARPNAESP